jgi:hypothetical protein
MLLDARLVGTTVRCRSPGQHPRQPRGGLRSRAGGRRDHRGQRPEGGNEPGQAFRRPCGEEQGPRLPRAGQPEDLDCGAVRAGGVATVLALDGLTGRLPVRTLPASHGLDDALAAAVMAATPGWSVRPLTATVRLGELDVGDGSWIRTLTNDSGPLTLPHSGCIHGIHASGSSRSPTR